MQVIIVCEDTAYKDRVFQSQKVVCDTERQKEFLFNPV